MTSIVQELYQKNLISSNNKETFMFNTQYEVITGSVAYGCNETSKSDFDIYAMCMPKEEVIYPHKYGYIVNFDTNIPNFEQFQQHHIYDKQDKREYDITIFGIIRYFRLLANCNPNMIDTIFVPEHCVLNSTNIGKLIVENRHLFLSKKCWHTFKGYAYSQKRKVETKEHRGLIQLKEFEEKYNIPHDMKYAYLVTELQRRNNDVFDSLLPDILGKLPYSKLLEYKELFDKVKECSENRAEIVKSQKYDYKFAMHLVRLLNEVEEILTEHDLHLDRNREQLKSIRNGDWSIEDVNHYFKEKELSLEKLYQTSTLRHNIDEKGIKKVLMHCLEEYYGAIDQVEDNKLIHKINHDMRNVSMILDGAKTMVERYIL